MQGDEQAATTLDAQGNPVAPIPRGEATPVRGFQFHQEFESQW